MKNPERPQSLICAELNDTSDSLQANFEEVAAFLFSYGALLSDAIKKLVREFEGKYYQRGLEDFDATLKSMQLNQEILKLKQEEILTRVHRLIHELELNLK